MPLFGGGPKCGVCDMTVYFNEERRGIGRVFHISCFKCNSCNKTLDSVNCSEHDDALFCRSCYGKNFGPRGYGFAGGAAGLSSDSGQPSLAPTRNGTQNGTHVDCDDPDCCPRCGKRVYFAEQTLALHRKWHKLCFKCSSCSKALDSTNCTEHQDSPYCRTCYAKNFGPRGYGFAGGGAGLSTAAGQPSAPDGLVPMQTGPVNVDDPESCPRCGRRVYFAEQVLTLGRKWHKPCFKCMSCNKKIDTSTASDHDGQLYCKNCYGRHFGPKGVGYGVGAGALQTV